MHVYNVRGVCVYLGVYVGVYACEFVGFYFIAENSLSTRACSSLLMVKCISFSFAGALMVQMMSRNGIHNSSCSPYLSFPRDQVMKLTKTGKASW